MAERPLNELTAGELSRLIASGEATAERIASDCLARIDAREEAVRAWAAIDREAVLAAARAVDRRTVKGALAGIPFGVKDVIDTADLPTEMGSPIYRGHRPRADAASVALARRAGALLLGKTVTCEFAGAEPSATRNPLDPSRTPGGSSAGSAAAVADLMVPVAFGTQTRGSVLRPASFCGIVGFKPSFGLINVAGMKPGTVSFDTVGLLARSVEDCALFGSVLSGIDLGKGGTSARAPRIRVARTHLYDTLGADARAAFEDGVNRLGAAGATLSEAELPGGFSRIGDASATINAFERVRGLAHEFATNSNQLSPNLRALCEQGLRTPDADYLSALRFVDRLRTEISAAFDEVDVMVAPVATGEAPAGLGSTGDPRLQEPWTMLHTPSIALPTHRGTTGMPIGLQLVAARWRDAELLSVASWVFERLGAG